MSNEFDSRLQYMKEELDEVKQDVDMLKADVTEIKVAVTNHLTHQLMDIQNTLNNLDTRIKPFEKTKLKKDGANEFLNFIVKVIIGVAGLVWTVLEIGKNLG